MDTICINNTHKTPKTKRKKYKTNKSTHHHNQQQSQDQDMKPSQRMVVVGVPCLQNFKHRRS